jgi:hypothetical protein
LGLGLTISGFSVALLQLGRIASATQAEREAIRRVTSSELLFLGPQFGIVAAHFDGAVSDNDHSAAQKLLAIWSDLASHVSGRLSVREDADTQLVSRIGSSSLLAREAHEALNNRSVEVTASTRAIRREMAGVQSQIGALMGKMVSEAG